MKQSHDSAADYKFPVTANETLGKKTATFATINAVVGSKSLRAQTK